MDCPLVMPELTTRHTRACRGYLAAFWTAPCSDRATPVSSRGQAPRQARV